MFTSFKIQKWGIFFGLIVMFIFFNLSYSTSAQTKYKPLKGITPAGGVVQISTLLSSSSGQFTHKVLQRHSAPPYSESVRKYQQQQYIFSTLKAHKEIDNSVLKLIQQKSKSGLNKSTSIQLDALNENFQGISQTNYAPPDPVIAVGTNNVLEAVNTSFAVFNKSGSKISQTDFAVFFGSLANNVNLTDPKVIYDQYSQRFVMLLLGYNTSKSVYLIAVSQTSDPTGSWYKYSSDASLDGSNSTTNGADYPGLGYDNEAIYVTSNQYSNYLSGYFKYAKIRIFNKSQLYSGQSLTYNDFVNMSDNYGTVFTIKPAHHFGITSSAYLINTEPFGASSITLWRIDNPLNLPTLIKQATISIASYNSNSPYNTVKQKGTTILIDGGDSRTQDVMYRNGFLYTAFSTLHDWGSGTVEAIRYEKIDVNSNTAIIDALYGADNYYYFYPNIYVDAYGDIVLVYSRSNTNEYAGVYWSYRTPTDASAGSSQALKAGAGEYTVSWAMRNGDMRWGDYNGISLDASSDNQIWFSGEWATNSNSWSTQIGSFRFSPVLFANQNKSNLDLGGNLLVNSLLQISSQTKIGFKPNTNNSVKTLASGSVNSPLDRFGSQKHNNWNQTSSSYLLTNNFSAIDAPGQEQDARFDNLNAVTITAVSPEVASLSNIIIKFNDPWYLN